MPPVPLQEQIRTVSTACLISAQKGTLFLDEVSELPLLFQQQTTACLQEREVRRIGDLPGDSC